MAKLLALATRYNAEGVYTWVHKEAELEEAFIYLMTGVEDNFVSTKS